MKKIIPHLWFDTQAKEVTAFYATLFENSKIDNVSTIKDTPSGDCDIVSFTLASQKFMAISAGPLFKFTPAISFFTVFNDEAEIQKVWDMLVEGGTVMMPFQEYPWAKKYGWLSDKYGVSWQLSMSDNHQLEQKITPMLMFTKEKAGMVKEAVAHYTSIFPNSTTDMMVPYEQVDGEKEGLIKHSRFTLNGYGMMAMESTGPHNFTFNEAISFIVKCENQEEIDFLWQKLSADPKSEQCGWLKDKYGVSWQITPTAMDAMMSSGDKEKSARVTQAFLKMKKFDIQKLQDAFDGK